MSSQDGPSNHFDYSRNEASYGNYTNFMGQHGGVISNIGHQTTNYYQVIWSSPLGMFFLPSINECFNQ